MVNFYLIQLKFKWEERAKSDQKIIIVFAF